MLAWYNPAAATEDNQWSASSSTGAAVTAHGTQKDATAGGGTNTSSSSGTNLSSGFKLRRRPTPLPMTPTTTICPDADDNKAAVAANGGIVDPTQSLDPILLTRSISMKAAQSFNDTRDYFSSLTARNIGGPGWNADANSTDANNNTNTSGNDEQAETRDQTNDSDESYVHPFERKGWDSFGGNPWSGDRSVKTAKKDNKSAPPSSNGQGRDDPPPSDNARQQHHQLDLAGTMSSGGDSRDTYTALGSPSLEEGADDADLFEADSEYFDDSMCSYASWCGGSGDADVIGPITVGRVARDVKALLLNPLGSCDKIGRRCGRRGGGDIDGRRGGGSFAEDATISTWGSADGQTINTYEEDEYSMVSELSAEVGGGGGGGRSVGSKKNALFTNFATVRQKDRAPPMPTCNEEDGEADDDVDGSDELTLSNRRRAPESVNNQTNHTVGAPVAAAGAIPLRRVMSDTSLSQYGHEVTVTQHRRQLSTDNVPITPLPYAPEQSCPSSPQSQVAASPSHITSFDNVIDLRTPKPEKRPKSFSKTEALKRRKEVEAKIRAEHRAAKTQRDKEKAIEKAKLEALRSKQERERRIAEAAEAEAKRIEKEEARARKMEEIEQRKHEAQLAVARKEQQREEERVRKLEEKRLQAEQKAREAEERRNAQLAETEQKRLDRETAKQQAKEQKLATAAQKKAAAEEKKRAKSEKKAAKRAKKNKKKGDADGATPAEIQNIGGGPDADEEADSPATGSSIATPTADNITRIEQVDFDSEKVKDGETMTETVTGTSDAVDDTSGGILDSIVPALGAATAAGVLMFSGFVDSIADPVGIGKGKNLADNEEATLVPDENPPDVSQSRGSDPIAELMSGFGFGGDMAKSEVSDQMHQQSNFPSELPGETSGAMAATNPSIPEASKVIGSDQHFDTQVTSDAKNNKKDTMKRASVAALVTGAFARTRSVSRSRDRERALKHSEEEREEMITNSCERKMPDEKPTKRRRSRSISNTHRRSSSRGASNKTTPNAIAQSSEQEPPPSVVRNRAIVYQSFSNDPMSSLKMYKFISSIALPAASDDVFIKVQASTISFSDCLIRQGMWWGTGTVSLPATPGVDVVGRVCNISAIASQKFGISPGDYVAALIRCGGNARYVKASGSSLVKVPAKVDSAAAVCMVETYLSAFQSLHVGEPSSSRYNFDCYAGQNILVIGGISMVGQAMIELAKLGGAAKVYATARQKHHKFLRSVGAVPLPIGIEEWLPTFSEHMDIVVDAYCIDHYNVTSKSLKQGGKLVCIRTRPKLEEQELVWHVDANADRTARFYGKTICTYDIFESWEGNLKLCKNDLGFLFDMLRKGKVKPPIADCISLEKVAETQKLFEARRVQGFFVCKPWLK